MNGKRFRIVIYSILCFILAITGFFGIGSMFLTPKNGATGTIRFAINNGSPEKWIDGTAALATGGWHHVAVAYARRVPDFPSDSAVDYRACYKADLEWKG